MKLSILRSSRVDPWCTIVQGYSIILFILYRFCLNFTRCITVIFFVTTSYTCKFVQIKTINTVYQHLILSFLIKTCVSILLQSYHHLEDMAFCGPAEPSVPIKCHFNVFANAYMIVSDYLCNGHVSSLNLCNNNWMEFQQSLFRSCIAGLSWD